MSEENVILKNEILRRMIIHHDSNRHFFVFRNQNNLFIGGVRLIDKKTHKKNDFFKSLAFS